MSTPTQVQAVRMTRRIRAPRDRVFRAWTEPEHLVQWFAPEGFTVPSAEADARVGGRYRCVMRAPDGAEHTAHGVYLEVDPPSRLVFTWAWEGGMDGAEEETQVTVELHARGEATELVLIHERFGTEASRANHEQGWTGCLNRLEALFDT